MTKRDGRFDRLFDSSDQILGPVENLSDDDLAELLEESGIDTDALSRRMYEKISDLVGRYHIKNKDVPVQLAQALREFRPPDTPTADPEVAAERARQWIAKLLGPKPPARRLEVAYSFRNRKRVVSSEDSKVLESLAEELRRKVERKE